MTSAIPGIHHITAIASDPQQNLDFYTGTLGLRLVKLTVNFDAPTTYHLYFGDEAGHPGTILTFFPWPGARRGGVGNGQVSAAAFAIPVESMAYWTKRLAGNPGLAAGPATRFGEDVIRIADPDGLPIELIATPSADPDRARTGGSVPGEHAIRGFHSATLSEASPGGTEALLVGVMGWRRVGQEGDRHRYAAGPHEAAGMLVDLVAAPNARHGRPGAGTVHHIAWRTPDDGQQEEWRADLLARGHEVTPVMDRKYFRSIYFHEPGGILFEIATDPPGFAADETAERLGERLMLPYWLEARRSAIEDALPRLTRHDLPQT